MINRMYNFFSRYVFPPSGVGPVLYDDGANVLYDDGEQLMYSD